MPRIKSLIGSLIIGASFLTYASSFQPTVPNTKPRSTPIAVGEMAPDFTLKDQHGNKVTLSDAKGKRPVILVFYRGYW